ncbi:MAG: amino acid synthesis family protein [Hyphomicrobiales bacterium]
MPEVDLRKTLVLVEQIFHEGGPARARPVRRAAALAVITNPYAGRYEPDIAGFMDDLKPLGLTLADKLINALGADPGIVEGFGKGAIVGLHGETEHGALWHVPGGYSMRERLGDSMAIVPSTKKVAGPGARIDIPITHINAAYVRSHFDAMEVGLADAPHADEMVLILAMTTGGRVHARVGGLRAQDIEGKDGLR